MKYIIMPVLRLLFVVVAFTIVYPIVYFFVAFEAMWHLSLKPIREVYDAPFWAEDAWVVGLREYWVYQTAIDYLLRKKTFIVKPPKR